MADEDTPTYDIDKDIPVPKTSRSGKGAIPLGELEVGDSILFPLSKRDYVQVKASRLKRTIGMQFTVRAISDTEGRVWRVK